MGKKLNNTEPKLSSEVIKIAAKYMIMLAIVFSIFILLRGHNHPGGGFIGGLVAGAGIYFYALAHGTGKVLQKWYVKPMNLLIAGLSLCMATAIAGIIFDGSVLKSFWLKWDAGFLGQIKLGTPLLFDAGVYLSVAGSFLLIIILIMEEYGWK